MTSMLIPYKKWFSLLLIFSFVFLSQLTFIPTASAIDFNPFSVEPGQVGRTLKALGPTPASGEGEGVLNKKLMPPEQVSKQNIEAAKISFVLNGIRLSGNHVYTKDELLKIFSPFIHKKITVAKLMALVQEVTGKYQKDGYFLSKALLPQQQIKDGVVKVQIVEGFISQVEVQGVKGRSAEFISKYGRAIEAVRPIKLDKLERYLLLINDVTGYQVKSLIAPDPKVPLGSKLTLVTQHTLFNITATRDNYQTRYLGPLENSVYASANSVILPGGTLYGRALAGTPTTKLEFYELKHTQAIGVDGLTLGIDSFYTQTNPQFILDPLDVKGFSGDGNLFASYPIIRSRERSFYLQGQFDVLNSHTNVLEQQLYYDRIRDLLIGLQYDDVIWKGQDSIYLGLDKGFNILGATNEGFHSRLGGRSDFLKLNATLSRAQFLNDRFSLFGLVTGQYASSVLLTSEVFTFGGPFLGRGYDLSQFTSDEAVAGTAEFRMDTNPNFPFFKQAQYYAFFDAAKFWNRSELLSLAGQGSAASAGVGIRANPFAHFHVDGFIGRPLTVPNATQIILGKNGHAFLAFFQLSIYS